MWAEQHGNSKACHGVRHRKSLICRHFGSLAGYEFSFIANLHSAYKRPGAIGNAKSLAGVPQCQAGARAVIASCTDAGAKEALAKIRATPCTDRNTVSTNSKSCRCAPRSPLMPVISRSAGGYGVPRSCRRVDDAPSLYAPITNPSPQNGERDFNACASTSGAIDRKPTYIFPARPYEQSRPPSCDRRCL